MTTQNSNVPATVKLTQTMLQAPASVMEMIQLPEIQKRWVDTYNSVNTKKDGEMRFAAEVILFNQVAGTKLKDCDRFSVYASFIELAISGLSLRDGLTYIIAYGKVAQFMVGWQGRLEQMQEIPDIIHVSEPQLVYDCDLFDYEKGMKTIIHAHQPQFPRPEGSKILFVYMIVHFKHGKEVFMMDCDEVINIRNNYSKSYKSYVKALASDLNKDKKEGDVLIGKAKGQNGWYDYDIEPPMWLSAEGQAFKKTLVRRAWKSMKKLPKHEALDTRYEDFVRNNPDAEQVDPDEIERNQAALDAQKKAVDAAISNNITILPEGDEVAAEDAEHSEETKAEVNTAATAAPAAEKPKTKTTTKTKPTAAEVAKAQPELASEPEGEDTW